MSLVRDIDSPEKPPVYSSVTNRSDLLPMKVFIITLFVAVLLGVGGGWALGHGKADATISTKTTASNTKTDTSTPNTAGIDDLKTFKDQAEGTLKDGGIEGEGSFHLVRPGGESQYVYLTSSTVDLSKYIDKKIRVHGVTIAGQKAGWLMDVGFVEVLQ